jgi:HSP20 family protein
MVDFKSLVPWRGNQVQMSAPRNDFFDPFVTFRREMDRMFDDFFGGDTVLPSLAGWQSIMPAIGMDETDKEVVVTVELPGVTEKDVEVDLAGDVLTIKGEKKAENEHKNDDSYFMERRFGSFERSIRLPFEVKDEKVDAKFTNGVLTIRLPKPPELYRSVRRIEVRSQ